MRGKNRHSMLEASVFVVAEEHSLPSVIARASAARCTKSAQHVVRATFLDLPCSMPLRLCDTPAGARERSRGDAYEACDVVSACQPDLHVADTQRLPRPF